MSAFKTLFTDMPNNGGDYSKLPKDLTKQMLKVFVKETSPYFLVSDSFFFVPAYFTKAALDEFERRFSNVKVQDLNEKVILINNWTLELKKVDSNAVFTSYAGLEVRLIVHSFKPQLGESIHPTRWPTNLYRDDEFKTTIQAMRHKAVQESVAKLPAPELASAQNVVSSKGDDWNFKEGNTAVVALGGKVVKKAQPAAPKVTGKKIVKKVLEKQSKKAGGASLNEKVKNFTPSKKVISKGKQSTSGKKVQPSPSGKKSKPGTTDNMNMATLKNFMKFQKGKKASGKASKK